MTLNITEERPKYQTCADCHVEKLLDEDFHLDRSRRLGRKGICKACANSRFQSWRATHAAEHVEATRRWRLADPERARKTAARSRARNRARNLAREAVQSGD